MIVEGASEKEGGDNEDIAEKAGPRSAHPPLICDFFKSEFFYPDAEFVDRQHWQLMDYIRKHWGVNEPLGTGKWRSLNLEDVFTSLAIESEFSPAGTDSYAYSLLLLNSIKNYIREIIGHSTIFRFGQYTHLLARNLKPDDSVITFNYDLLMDQEFLLYQEGPLQYNNFHLRFLDKPLVDNRKTEENGSGLYLKLHGSLNWFLCTSPSRPRSGQVDVNTWINQCIFVSAIGRDFDCEYCRGKLTSLLIPPLLNKPITQNSIIRNVWANALYEISNADNLVVIGYSFPTTDFFAGWLFRSALQKNKDAKVWVINPLNDPTHQGHREFKERMDTIFVQGYSDQYHYFDQIEYVLDELR